MALDPIVQAAAITAGSSIIVALIGGGVVWLQRQHSALKAVREQVQNSHQTNLRDDIDRVLIGLADVAETQRSHGYELGHMRRDIQDVRDDVRQEREERLVLSERLDSHLILVAETTAASVAAVVSENNVTAASA